MDEILQYLDEHWGKARGCAQCEGEARFVCSTCEQTMYCGEQCQTTHWNTQHRFACIAGNDDPPGTQKKRERLEGEEELQEEATKKERLEQPQLQEVGIEDITSDVWTRMSQFLSGQDLKNLKTSKIMEIRLRKAFFQRFRFVFTKESFYLNKERFETFKESVIAVRVSNIDDLKMLDLLGFKDIIDVKFSPGFNEPIKWLPPKLKYITFGDLFEYDIELPQSVTHVTFGNYVNLKARFELNKEKLIYFDQSKVEANSALIPRGFPNLEVLKMPSNFNGAISGINNNPSLHHLEFGPRFNTVLTPNLLNTQLTYLKLGDDFDQPLDNLPPTLRVLILGRRFNQPLPRSFRDSNIKVLTFHFDGDWDHPLDNLPHGLHKLTLTESFVHRLVLPPSLEILDLNNRYAADEEVIPVTVTDLTIENIRIVTLPSGEKKIFVLE